MEENVLIKEHIKPSKTNTFTMLKYLNTKIA